ALALADLDEDFFGPALTLVACQWQNRAPLHRLRDRQAGGVEQRRWQIDETYELAQAAAGLERTTPQCSRHAHGTLVARTLVLAIAALEVAAVIRSEKHDGVPLEAQAL